MSPLHIVKGLMAAFDLAVILGLWISVYSIGGAVSFLIWLLVLPFSYMDSTLGRFARYADVWFADTLDKGVPRNSTVVTMTLDGHLPLQHLKSLFTVHVLHKPLSTNTTKLRYPELQQYITKFMGFYIWKWNSSFSIDDHIVQHYPETSGVDIELLHQELNNKPFDETRSPWEFVLVHANDDNGLKTSVIAARFHHMMVDGKSILKLLIECLGQKQIKSANSSPETWGFGTYFKFILFSPVQYIILILQCFYNQFATHTHPWKNHRCRSNDANYNLIVSFSPKLLLSDIKRAAKINSVTATSVLMSLASGAIRKNGTDLAQRDTGILFSKPKENHPEFLCNHFYMTFLSLPTKAASAATRLKKSNEIFCNAKRQNLGVYTNINLVAGGMLIYPLSKLFTYNHFAPAILSNVAGDEEGFSVGGYPCTDFRITTAQLIGFASVFVCFNSYKDGVRVGVSAREGILTKAETDKLAADIGDELKELLAI